MSAQTRAELLKAVEAFGELYPELRFGQMIANLVTLSKWPTSQEEWAAAVWDVEDEDLLATIRGHFEQDNRRQGRSIPTTEPAQEPLRSAASPGADPMTSSP